VEQEKQRAEGDGLMKAQVYRDERPAESMTPAHEYARTHEPGWVYTAARIVMGPPARILYRLRARGLEHIPAEGPMILAPNHFSNFDHFFVGVRLRREIRFMGKSQFFGEGANPIIDYIFRNAGHFPVRRGYDDPETFITANSILERDGCVGIYAEGGRSRSGGLGEPKRGVGRIALESGAPVVPAAIHGSAAVRGWKRGRFPQISVAYGEPLTFARDPEASRERQQEVAEEIFDRIRTMYEELEGE
jgi:1-acyl-sn-glycerol-3-phosphate acyltransferase